MDERVLTFGSFEVFPDQRLLLNQGKPLRQGSRAFDILQVLLERPGEVISKEALIKRVWPDTVAEDTSLRVHIAALRKALGDDHAAARLISLVGPGGIGKTTVAQAAGAVSEGFARPDFQAAARLHDELEEPVTHALIGRRSAETALIPAERCPSWQCRHQFTLLHSPPAGFWRTVNPADEHSRNLRIRYS